MKFGIIANIKKNRVIDVVVPFIEWLLSKKQQVVIDQTLQDLIQLKEQHIQIVPVSVLSENSDCVIAMGGDGTMLTAAHLVGKLEKPILGINLGGLGFLAEVGVENLYPKMEQVLAGQYTIESRMVLKAALSGDLPQSEYFALNDIVLSRGRSPRIIQIDATIDGNYFSTYYADGIIVATPTGSTAYSLSAWGPIVVPSLESMILNPLCPHSLTARPTVVPVSSVIGLQIRSSDIKATLVIDGHQNIDVTSKTHIRIEKGSYSIRLVTFTDHNFFDILRRKLHWGSLPKK